MQFTCFAPSPGVASVSAQGEKIMIKKILLGLTVAAFALTGGAFAQGIKRTPLQKIDFPQGYTTVTAIAEVPAGGASGRHSHPGIETGYVLEGELELAIDGQPPLKLKAGESYQIPAGAIHDAKAGDKPFKVLGIYIVDKTKPLAIPAP
jgi:mannose-6-phosphate isomerase-like protein (cupin superfamily)